MFHQIKSIFKRRRRGKSNEIFPDEIFLDSKNLPDFDNSQFEGRIEKPIPQNVLSILGFFMTFVVIVFVFKLWGLQMVEGETYRNRSERNSLHSTLIFADRGVIYDRNNIPIVWNTINPEASDYSLRVYATSTGLSTVLGYIKYPTKDSNGFYYQSKFDPKDGLEKIYDTVLSGKNGTRIVETDVKGNVVSESVVNPPVDGENLNLSIDLNLQRRLNSSLLDNRQ